MYIYIHICLYVYINIIISGACPHEPESERASEGTAEEQATLGRPVAICLNSCVGPTAVGLRKPSLPTCSQSISGSSHVDYHRTSSLQASPSGLVYIHIYAYIVYYTNMRIYIYIYTYMFYYIVYIYIYVYVFCKDCYDSGAVCSASLDTPIIRFARGKSKSVAERLPCTGVYEKHALPLTRALYA